MMDDCIEYAGCKRSDGYGWVSFRGKNMCAHRAEWIKRNGPIPKGLHVLHLCDNPPCINVNHLFLGTHEENQKDKLAKGRQSRLPGELNGRAKLTKEDVLAIRGSSLSHKELAANFGITVRHVHQIISRRNWKHV